MQAPRLRRLQEAEVGVIAAAGSRRNVLEQRARDAAAAAAAAIAASAARASAHALARPRARHIGRARDFERVRHVAEIVAARTLRRRRRR